MEKLRKQLGLLDVFCIASGAMISSGLFVLPGIAFTRVGPSLFLSYVLASFIALPTMLSTAELVTAMPKAGGDYFYVSRSMGFLVGTIGGLSSWFSLAIKGVFALIGMAAYLELVAPIPLRTLSVMLCVVFVILNLIGIKEAARTQVTIVLALLVILIAYIAVGLPNVQVERYTPFIPYGIGSMLSAAGIVFISYGGLVKIASVAEEVKDPARNIPLGMIFSLLIVGIIYTLVVFVTIGVLPANELSNNLTPISDAAQAFSGTVGQIVMAIGALLAFISTANAGIISSSRYPMAMSRDGLLPSFVERINKKYGTPHYSIILTGIFMVLAALFLELEFLVKLGSSLLILLYIMANCAVIIMRESKVQNYQPKFIAPLYPLVQILGIIGGVFLLLEMGRDVLLISALFAAVSVGWYFIYVGTKQLHEFALIHVIERILDKDLTSGKLASELKKIIKERDDIVEDRFDHIIDECPVFDIEEETSAEDFFNKISPILSPLTGMQPDKLAKLFIRREQESSTIIRNGIAIPHIIIDGEKTVQIILARAKKGIFFPDHSEPVHTVFLIAGTKDERNFHLRSLSAIAQICQQKDFDQNWMNAKNAEEIRDIVLLAERRRFEGKN